MWGQAAQEGPDSEALAHLPHTLPHGQALGTLPGTWQPLIVGNYCPAGVGNLGLASSPKLEAGWQPGTGLAPPAFLCELGCCVMGGLRGPPARWL